MHERDGNFPAAEFSRDKIVIAMRIYWIANIDKRNRIAIAKVATSFRGLEFDHA